MASEKVKLFSKLELEMIGAAGSCYVLTDLPGYAMAQRFSFPTPIATTRRPVTSRLPYNTTGHLLQLLFVPTGAGQTALYRARVWARELPSGSWQWYSVPVIDTPVEFGPQPLPVPGTPEEWRPEGLPIVVTAEEWKAVALSIPGTPEEWSTVKLPVKPTPDVPEWSDLEVDK